MFMICTLTPQTTVKVKFTRAVRSRPVALSRTSCNGHDRDSRSRCRRVCLLSRAEPGRSSPKHSRTAWLSSSRAAARSSSSLLHSRAKLFTVGLLSCSDSDWDRCALPLPDTRIGVLSPLVRRVKPVTGSLAISCHGAPRFASFKAPLMWSSLKLATVRPSI